MKVIDDEYYMGLALDMAERALGQTGANRVVGSVKEGMLDVYGTRRRDRNDEIDQPAG
ncbi:hypothetical protein [Paenibacillus sanguinis]|uniref:hypothetical protein n=1 Tax=Paenibacillus sanguinis TaxID=225906 RepID=UPI00035EF92C